MDLLHGMTVWAMQEVIGQPANVAVSRELFTSGVTNLIIAVTSLVTAGGIVYVNIIAARAKAAIEMTAKAVTEKANEIGETTRTTLGHVNSAATELNATIKALREENAKLVARHSDDKETAAVLAANIASEKQAAALIITDGATLKDKATLERIEADVKDIRQQRANTEPTSEAKADKVLDRIEVNTAETVKAVKDKG